MGHTRWVGGRWYLAIAVGSCRWCAKLWGLTLFSVAPISMGRAGMGNKGGITHTQQYCLSHRDMALWGDGDPGISSPRAVRGDWRGPSLYRGEIEFGGSAKKKSKVRRRRMRRGGGGEGGQHHLLASAALHTPSLLRVALEYLKVGESKTPPLSHDELTQVPCKGRRVGKYQEVWDGMGSWRGKPGPQEQRVLRFKC